MDHLGKAGIIKGDIITKIDEKEINKMVELREYLYSKKPGEKIKLTLENSELKEVEIELRKEIRTYENLINYMKIKINSNIKKSIQKIWLNLLPQPYLFKNIFYYTNVFRLQISVYILLQLILVF